MKNNNNNIVFNAAGLIRLCESLYLLKDGLKIHSVKPSIDKTYPDGLVITYSNVETNGTKVVITLQKEDDKKEFLSLLNQQIQLQQSGPLSDPNIVRWM